MSKYRILKLSERMFFLQKRRWTLRGPVWQTMNGNGVAEFSRKNAYSSREKVAEHNRELIRDDEHLDVVEQYRPGCALV